MLIDDRFGESKVKQLLPRWWSIIATLLRSCSCRIFHFKKHHI
jgi:hypothetical protein